MNKVENTSIAFCVFNLFSTALKFSLHHVQGIC